MRNVINSCIAGSWNNKAARKAVIILQKNNTEVYPFNVTKGNRQIRENPIPQIIENGKVRVIVEKNGISVK